MATRCPTCGESNPDRAKFCLECGSSMVIAATHESRRTVTVVFADMVGFTALGERLDEESLRRVMDGFYSEMRRAIEGQAGTLAKFIGDAVLAVWGTPEVREDDALRAVRAAEAMRSSLAGLNEDLQRRWGVRVGMRTGVNTGEVVVDPARPADLLVGNTLNVAARLEQAARDGEVLIGPETQRLVRDEAVLEAVEPLVLKGKAEPLPAWRLVDGTRRDRRPAPPGRGPRRGGRGGGPPRRRSTSEGGGASRPCRFVSVIGSPGLGKTRLAAELVASVRREAIVLEGHCEASGEGITFQPVAEMIRSAAGIGEDDGPEVARAKLEALLPVDDPDRERVTDRAGALLGLAPASSTEETFWAMRRLLEAAARIRPVMLLLEDIHWGQPTFLDLIEHLAEWMVGLPVLIVALARPELREIRPRLAVTGGLVADALALEPLDRVASRALVDGLFGEARLPRELAQRVLDSADGNPLFLGEMLRMLADDGVLRREGGAWVATGEAAQVAVPPTIHALLAARIERLAADERSVVERASVIGHQFYRGAVAELTPPPAQPTVDGALVTLQRKELVRAEEALWLDERVFRFHHVLIRDAAYRSLLKEARADLHERYAGWLERKAGDVAGEHEEMIAFHLEQAYGYRLELGPLDEHGLDLGARAGARLRSAGRRALEREDLPAASNLLRRALAPLPDGERPDVLVDLGEALLSAGDTAAAEEVVEELGLGADAAGDERLGAWATALAGQLDNLTGAGHVRETVEAAAEAAEILARAGDRAGEAKAHQVVGAAEALLGRVAAAEAALDRALVAARAAGDRRRVTSVLAGAPRAALWGPAPIVRASGRCLDVVRILRMTPGTRHVEAAALRCQAVLEAMRGRGAAAQRIIGTCRATFEELGLGLELHETAVFEGIVELLSGDPAAAETELRGAQEGFLALGVDGGAAQAAALLARALLEQNRDDEALDATRFAEERGGEDLKTTIAWLGVRAEALARRGAIDEALPLAERAASLAEPTDALADKADALMALARVRRAAGQADGAREAAEEACTLYAEKNHAVGVTRAARLAGAEEPLLEPQGSPADADAVEAVPPSAPVRAFLDAHARRDWEALGALFEDDYVLVDHRRIGWDTEMFSGADQMLEQQRSIPDAGIEYEVEGRLVRAEPGVEAGLLAWSGPGWAFEFGVISRLRDGLFASGDIFEPDDRDGMMRRFDELVCERDLEQVPVGRAQVEILQAFNRRDWQRVQEGFHRDFLHLEHRQFGWDVHDREGVVAMLESWPEMVPDARMFVSRLEAHSEHLMALVYGGGGTADGGELELLLAAVLEERGGRIVLQEAFEPDERDGLLRRFEELRRERELEQTPAGRLHLEYLRANNARDWDAFARLHSDQFVWVEHRALGWDLASRAEAVDLLKSWAEISPDARLASPKLYGHTEHLLAGVFVGGGSVDGTDWEVAVGFVREERDGLLVRAEAFEPDDREGIVRRFEELAAERKVAD